jgi:exosortase H (IPTLxxWG-CTERM-specific)
MQLTTRVISFLGANRPALRFLVLFALIFGLCYFVFGVAPGVRLGLIKPYTELLARGVAVILRLFGEAATATGALVQTDRFSLNIAMGCDGVEAASLFLAGVLAFPTSWRAKLIGLSFGIPLIQLINLGRLVGLYYAGLWLPSIVEEVHVYVAQTVIILLSTALLVFWLERFAVRQHRPA